MALSSHVSGPIETKVRNLGADIFDPTDLVASSINSTLKARSAAFIILAHAEIEFAIEEECKQTANLLKNAIEPSLAMLAWGLTSTKGPPTYLGKKDLTPIETIVEYYEKNVITPNHGIKEHNLHLLLGPLGVDLKALSTDISVLDTFGGRRGALAHKSIASWTTNDLPSAHITTVEQAGRSADQLITAIRAGHSRIPPAPSKSLFKLGKMRNYIALNLRHLASKVEVR